MLLRVATTGPRCINLETLTAEEVTCKAGKKSWNHPRGTATVFFVFDSESNPYFRRRCVQMAGNNRVCEFVTICFGIEDGYWQKVIMMK